MTDREHLPIPDYDHLPEGSLAHRIRTLAEPELHRLLDYERAHADRVAVRQLIGHRLDALRSGDAEPSPGDPAAAQPEHAPPPRGEGPGRSEGSDPGTNQPLRYGVAEQTPNRNIRAR